MSSYFSESSQLLIKNWDIVKEVHNAEVNLSTQLRDYLFDFESILSQCAWWNDEWHFNRHSDTQVYISKRSWKRENSDIIWIGIENFSIESLFGNESLATQYVWVNGNHTQLVSALRNSMKDEPDIIGDIQTKRNSGYIVTNSLRKCLPDELDHFNEVIGKTMINFFSYHAQCADSFSMILNETEKMENQQENSGDK